MCLVDRQMNAYFCFFAAANLCVCMSLVCSFSHKSVWCITLGSVDKKLLSNTHYNYIILKTLERWQDCKTGLRVMSNPQTEEKGSIERKEHLQGFSFLCLVCRGREKIEAGESNNKKKKGRLGECEMGDWDQYLFKTMSHWHGTLLEISHTPCLLFPAFASSLRLVHTSALHQSAFTQHRIAHFLFVCSFQIFFAFNFSFQIPHSRCLFYYLPNPICSLFPSSVSLCIIEIPVIFLHLLFSLLSCSLRSIPTFVLPLLWSSHFLTQPWTSSRPPY